MEKDKNTDTSSSKLTGSLWFTSSTCTIIFSRYTVISVRNVRLFRPSHRFTCKMRCTWGTYPKTTQWPKCYDRCPKTSRSAPERYSVNVINRRRATNQLYSGFHCQARDKKVIRVRASKILWDIKAATLLICRIFTCGTGSCARTKSYHSFSAQPLHQNQPMNHRDFLHWIPKRRWW